MLSPIKYNETSPVNTLKKQQSINRFTGLNYDSMLINCKADAHQLDFLGGLHKLFI